MFHRELCHLKMSDRKDSPHSEDTYNENIQTSGGDYTGRDSYTGDRVEGNKIVNSEVPEHWIPTNGESETKENIAATIFDFISNTLSIDVLAVVGIVGTYFNWKLLFGVITPLLIALFGMSLGYISIGIFSQLYFFILPLTVLLLIGFYSSEVFPSFHSRHSCPKCSENGEGCTLRVKWWRILDSEKKIKEYRCKNYDYNDTEVYGMSRY